MQSTYEFDRIKKKKKEKPKYNRSDLIYDNKYSFYECYNIKNFNSLSFESKYPILVLFYNELNKFISLNPQKDAQKRKK